MNANSLQPISDIEPQSGSFAIVESRAEATPSLVRFSPLSYIEPLFAHKRMLVTSLLVAMLLGWLAILLCPRKYASEAKLLIRVGRESVSLDPTATTSETMMLQKTQEEEVNSALELVTSRHIAELVVDRVGAVPILDGHLPNQGSASAWQETISQVRYWASSLLYQGLLLTGVKDDLSDRELAVIKLQKSIYAHAPKKSTVVTVVAESKSPALSRALATATTEAFLTEHLRASTTEGSQQFFEKQAKQIEDKLTQVLGERSVMMQERNIASFESKQVALTTRLAAIKSDILSTQAALKQADSEAADLETKLDATPDEIVVGKLEQRDQTWSGMRTRLYDLELQERLLASTRTEQHPQLTEVRKQLKDAKGILAVLQSERVDQNRAPNPIKMKLYESLQQQQTTRAGLHSILVEKQRQFDETTAEIRELLEYELELEDVNRQIAVTEHSLGMLREKQEEARVIDELQSRQITNVSVVQPAALIERAVFPNKKLLAAAFVMLGIGTGLGLVFLRETSSAKLRTVDHVEAGLGQHVVATIPFAKTLSYVRRFVNRGDVNELSPTFRTMLAGTQGPRNSMPRSAPLARTIGILGVHEGCGASTVATGIAVSSAKNAGLNTMLVDADTQRRTISAAFRANGAPGVAEVLTGQAHYPECVQTCGAFGLKLLPVSEKKPDAAATAAQPSNSEGFINDLRMDHDVVVVDLPPADRPDFLCDMTRHLDQVFVVVESEQTDLPAAQRLVQRLQSQGTRVAGIVLNKSRRYMPRWLESLLQ